MLDKKLSFEPSDYSWANITNKEIQAILQSDINLLGNREGLEKEFPGLREIYLMSQCPEYIYMTCKLLLGIEISPMQACILHNLWVHPFPILIGSRGLSKAISPEEKIRVKNGWVKIKDLSVGDKVYGSDGKLCNVLDKTELQKDLNFYRITLRDGRTIDACEDHQWKVWSKNKNKNTWDNPIWTTVKTKDMFNNYYYNRKNSKSKDPEAKTKEFLYALPISSSIEENDDVELPIDPYVLGVLLGDGGMTTNSITITVADTEIIDRVKDRLPYGYKINKLKSKYGYQIVIDRSTGVKKGFRFLLDTLGLLGKKSRDKFIPEIYKYASQNQKLELLRGLMDTDGTSANNNIYFSTSSKQLGLDVLDLARSLGIHSKHTIYKTFIKGKRFLDSHSIKMYTNKKIFHLSRKLDYLSYDMSRAGQSKYSKVFITNIEYIGKKDGMCIQVDSPDNTYITKDYIVTHNSFLLGLYSLLRAVLIPGTKIVCVGAGFRQSKVLFSYVEKFWQNAPVLRSIFKNTGDGPKMGNDMFTFTFGPSMLYFIPLGPGGEKVRGLRANIIIADEMNSMDTDVYEIVVNNFAAVSMNPIEKMKQEARKKYYKDRKLPIPEELMEVGFQNQSIVAGTMGYEHQPMYSYWKRYKEIIDSKGANLKEAFGGVDVDLTYKDFCIMRLPYELIPKGFMDDKTIARAKATIHIGAYNSEYGCTPVKDSTGFFRKSIIDQCVANDSVIANDPTWPSYCPESFDAMDRGNSNMEYVMGVDPASETDNFAITIVEVHKEHQRVVYSWTTNKDQVREIDPKANYWSFCARHIRNLCKRFNIVKIGIDSQGGGTSLAESLHDEDILKKGEQPFWEEIDRSKSKETDHFDGLHILRLVHFANYQWLSNANHSLRKDLEARFLLFPRYNSMIAGLSSEGMLSSEDNIQNIEELKDELCTIVMTITGTRERWDTPQIKTDTNKVGRMRKDRYSSLLIANDLAREINRHMEFTYERPDIGGRVGQIQKVLEPEKAYYGPPHIVEKLNNFVPAVIRRS